VLGPLEVMGEHGPVDVGGAQPRRVLALLLAAPGRVVPTDAILEGLWGDDPPDSAAGTLQSYASRLRRVLEPGRGRGQAAQVLVFEPPGYRLDVPVDDVDHLRFDVLANRGRALLDGGDPAAARDALAEALDLWRGPALAEVADLDMARGLAARLEERRLVAIEDRLDADLALGRSGALVGELTELVDAHPLREGLRARLALTLYRSERQAEALRAIDDARRTLRDELGVDPGPALRELEGRILSQDPTLSVSPAPPDPARAERPHRREAPRAERPATANGSSPAEATPPVAAAGGGTALVGRRAELGQLVAVLDEAASATRIAVVEGEPGIGKTRLAEELASEASRRGALVLWGRAFEAGAAPAFWPWLSPLRALAAAVPERTVLVPELEALLAEARDPAAPPPSGPSRFVVLEATAGLLTAGATERPLVVVLDDVQWADPASLELLGFLAGCLADPPVLLLCTVRELEVGRNDAVVETLAALTRRPSTRRLRLRGLPPEAIGELIDQASGRQVGPRMTATIQARAEGNPFFATELARLLAVDGERSTADADVPAGVRDVVRRRLALLPPGTGGLLQVAAIIGRDVELGLLARSADRTLDACLDDLEPAVVQRVLVPLPDQPSTFRFSHALIREVIVEDVSTLRRARTHLKVADAVEAAFGDADDAAEILAEHLWAAVPIGVGRRAAAALERAAEVAARRSAYEAAERLLDRAVGLRRATGSELVDAEAELMATDRLFAMSRSLRGYPTVNGSPLMARAKELAQRTDRTDILATLLWAEWAAYDTACDYEQADPIAARLHGLAGDTEDPLTRTMGLWSWGMSRWHHGLLTEASTTLDAAMEAAAQVPERGRPLDLDAELRLLAPASATYLHDLVGDVDDVEARFSALLRRVPDRFGVALTASFAAAGAVAVGDGPRAEREADRGLEADPDGRFTFWGSSLVAYRGCGLILQGRHDEGLAALDDGLGRYLATGVRTNLPLFLAHRILGLTAVRRHDDALQAWTEAVQAVEAQDERFAEAVIAEAEARLRHAQGAKPDEVARLLRAGVAKAEAQGGANLARRLRRAAAELDLGLTLPS
jgi:DNA-binding SARP family transcriptional activator